MIRVIRARINSTFILLMRMEAGLPSYLRPFHVLYKAIIKIYLWLPQTTHEDFSSKWRTYVQNKLYRVELEILKKNLDETSVTLIDRYIERQVKGSFLYSSAEIRAWRKTRKIPASYIFPADTTAIHDVFAFHCGLCFLPKQCVAKLRTGCVIDGGAAAGDSSLMFLQYKPLKVYAVEPSPVQITEIQEVLRLNQKEQAIAIVPFGLSDKRETIKISDQRAGQFNVQTITIDDFANDKKVSCIKLDVEGVEHAVIRGAKKTIIRDRPLLLICIYHSPEDFLKIKPLIDSWGLGYRFLVRDTELCNSLAGVHLMLIAYCEEVSKELCS